MEEREIHLREYYRVIVKRRYTFLTIFIALFVITVIATFSTTPVYEATTKVLIQKPKPSNLAEFYYVPYDPDFYNTQYQLIKSRSVAERVVNMLSLDTKEETYFPNENKSPGIIHGTVGWFRKIFTLILNITGISKPEPDTGNRGEIKPDETESASVRLARMISGSITINPIKNSTLVNISYMSTNPELAALIVNSVAKAYMDDILEMNISTSRHAISWLTEKADKERAKLEESENALQKYMERNDIVTLENRLALVPEKLSEVASKIARAETDRKEMETLYTTVKEMSLDLENVGTIPAVASDPTVQELRMQILKAEQNIIEMSKKFGRKHPVMITAMGDLKILNEKKTEEIRRVIETIKNRYALARANEENFRKMADRTKTETLELNQKFIQYNALKREVETNKQLFDVIIRKIKEHNITQDIRTVDVWVVEKAAMPEFPVKPNKPLNTLLGLIVGLMGGMGMVFFLEYLDNTVKSPEDIDLRLGVPVLGMVMLSRSREKNIDIIVTREPQSVIAESYKGIRTAILLSSADKPPQNILVTSITVGEGKTTTACNLALTIALAEHSVLLIDSDLRRPRIHKIFGLDNSKGLSTYLAGVSDLNIISIGTMPEPCNLSVLPSGPVPPNPSELLSSNRMENLLKVINERFDIIIWDSSPLLSVTDSLILSKLLDGTIIVAKAGSTTFESLSRGLKSLHDMESNLLGIVINRVDMKHGGYYYGYNNGYDSSEETSR